MPSQGHHRSRVIGTVGAAAAHTYLSVLGLFDYLNFTVNTRYGGLHEAADEEAWAWIHLGVAVFLISSLAWSYHRVRLRGPWEEMTITAVACSVGFAAMFTWAFFNFLWGLTTIRPVSLAGPGLAFAVAAGEQLLAHAWNRGALTRDR